MTKWVRLSIVGFVLMTSVLLFQNAKLPVKIKTAFAPRITVKTQTQIAYASPHIFGANYLTFYFNDGLPTNSSDRTHFEQALQTMGVRKLRFPGGNFSQNYDWESNKLNDAAYPPALSIHSVSFRDFCDFTRSHQIRPVLVINIEELFVKKVGTESYNYSFDEARQAGRILASTQKAMRWVQAAKDYQCDVAHWEIGNESNASFHRHPFKAIEYARIAALHVQRMREIDPDLRIALNNGNPMNIDLISFRDRLTPAGEKSFLYNRSLRQREEFLSHYGTSETQRELAAKTLNGGVTVTKPAAWWPTIIKHFKSQNIAINFIEVHYYQESNRWGTSGASKPPAIGVAPALIDFQKKISQLTGVYTPLSIGELGVGSGVKSLDTYNYIHFGLDTAELMGEFLKAGVFDIKTFDLHFIKKSMTDFNTYALTEGGKVFGFVSKGVGRQILAIENSDPDLYSIASRGLREDTSSGVLVDEQTLAVLLLNRSALDKSAQIVVDQPFLTIKGSKSLSGNLPQETFQEVNLGYTATADKKSFTVKVPPYSVSRFLLTY